MRQAFWCRKQQQGEITWLPAFTALLKLAGLLLWIAGIVAFVIVALTWVPDWISPEGTNGTGNRGGIEGAGVGSTARMIK